MKKEKTRKAYIRIDFEKKENGVYKEVKQSGTYSTADLLVGAVVLITRMDRKLQEHHSSAAEFVVETFKRALENVDESIGVLENIIKKGQKNAK